MSDVVVTLAEAIPAASERERDEWARRLELSSEGFLSVRAAAEFGAISDDSIWRLIDHGVAVVARVRTTGKGHTRPKVCVSKKWLKEFLAALLEGGGLGNG